MKTITIIHDYICDHCGKTHAVKCQTIGAWIQAPQPPKDWIRVEDELAGYELNPPNWYCSDACYVAEMFNGS